MSDIQHLLQHQAEWQKKRQRLSWADKIRMVEALQGSLRQLKSSEDSPRNSQPPDSRKPLDSEIVES
jgi:hypothetical protein